MAGSDSVSMYSVNKSVFKGNFIRFTSYDQLLNVPVSTQE